MTGDCAWNSVPKNIYAVLRFSLPFWKFGGKKKVFKVEIFTFSKIKVFTRIMFAMELGR